MTNTTLYFTPAAAKSQNKFCSALSQMIAQVHDRPIVFLCIGSDRATGDCLGPIIGEQLSSVLSAGNRRNGSQKQKAAVYGSLRHTVHAGNLSDTLSSIYNRYSDPFIIAIDASLGVINHMKYDSFIAPPNIRYIYILYHFSLVRFNIIFSPPSQHFY